MTTILSSHRPGPPCPPALRKDEGTPRRSSPASIALLLSALLFSCGGGSTGPDPSSSAVLAPEAATLQVGEVRQLTLVDGSGEAIEDPGIEWSSSDAAVTVDPEGVATGVTPGSATVRAESGSMRASAEITVVDHLPISGTAVPELAAFDRVMLDFMGARGIRAGALAVLRSGRVVLSRGYGWKDRTESTPLRPDAMFRLASVTKPVTAAAIRRLVSRGELDLDAPVYPLLDLQPAPEGAGVADDRIRQITVRHLLDHEGGWDAPGSVPDARAISAALGLSRPPEPADVARHMMTKPLDFEPGSRSAYSNVGYGLLGLVIEHVTGRDYTDHVREEIFPPASATDVALARTRPDDRHPREPWYSDPAEGCSVFVIDRCETVPYPDGGFYFEGFEAYGGLVSSPPAIGRFLETFWMDGRARPEGATDERHTFFGSINGSFTLARQRSDGVDLVALFNQRTDATGLDYGRIRVLLDSIAEGIEWN